MKSRTPLLLLAALPVGLLTPGAAWSQGWDIDASLHQSFSTIDVLESPLGFHLGLTRDRLVGPVGVQFSFDRVSEGSVHPDTYCLHGCVDALLDRTASLSVLRMSFRLGTAAARPFQATLGVSGILSSFKTNLTSTATEQRMDGSRESGLGFGVVGELRLPELLSGVRPLVYGQIERIGPEPCDLDDACFFSAARTVKALGVGIAWSVR